MVVCLVVAGAWFLVVVAVRRVYSGRTAGLNSLLSVLRISLVSASSVITLAEGVLSALAVPRCTSLELG